MNREGSLVSRILYLLLLGRIESYITTDGPSASLSWNEAPIWGLRPDFITVRQLLVCWDGELSLTRGRVCRLQLLLVLASAVILGSESLGTRDHILLSHIRDFAFRRLLLLAGLRWRYSTPPPHGGSTQYDWISDWTNFMRTEYRSPNRTAPLSVCFIPCHENVCQSPGNALIYASVFFAAETCLPNRCPAMFYSALPRNVLSEAPPSRWSYSGFQASCHNTSYFLHFKTFPQIRCLYSLFFIKVLFKYNFISALL
jgi:hypothetical protein